MKTPRFLLAACISLALAFTFSCSSDSSDDLTANFALTNSGTFTDSRDSKTYEWVRIGGKVWMAKNLNFAAPGSKCGDSDSRELSDANTSACDAYGRLYDWATAMANSASSSATPSGVQGVCPPDWHLPSDAEWDDLMDAVGGESVAGTKLKKASGWYDEDEYYIPGTDDFGFSALPGGDGYGTSFRDAGYSGSWWSSTEDDSSYAYIRYMGYGSSEVNRSSNRKTALFSVRCLQD